MILIRYPGMSKILSMAAAGTLLLATILLAHSAPLQVPAARETFVFDPIFQGQVYMYQAGKDNATSIVLIHGLGEQGAQVWDTLIPSLIDRYHVVTFDLPGFGRSSKTNALYSPAMYAAFVKWVVDSYVNGPLVLIGHSLGGAVALRYASAYPQNLQHLILVDTAGILHKAALTKYMAHIKLKNWTSNLLVSPLEILNQLTGYTIERLQRLPFDPEIALGSAALRERLLGADPAKIAGLALVNEDFSRLIELVRMPTLILWGAEDSVTPLRTGKLLGANLLNARLEIIPEAGHSPMLEQPERFNRMIIETLSSPHIQKHKLQAPKTERIGYCRSNDGVIFTGGYKSIEVIDSNNVLLVDVTTGQLDVSGSEVVIETSQIIGHDVALNLHNARVTGTASYIEADIAISASKSRLDLAGVKLKGRKAAVRCDDRSSLLFSVSRVESPYTSGYLHGSRDVTPENPL